MTARVVVSLALIAAATNLANFDLLVVVPTSRVWVRIDG